MSRINCNLLNSLMWNLQEMTNLINMIRRRVGDVKCSSWRHPLLPCGELDVQQLLQDNKDSDRYTYLLELTFDRLLYVLNLIVKYLEACESLSRFRPGKNVKRPKNLSMASILFMIWDRIQAQCESAGSDATPGQVSQSKALPPSSTTTTTTVSSFTQSDMTCLSACPTCELAQSMVTQIVLKMETFFGDDALSSALLTQRKVMKEKLIGTSNWSAMTTWVNAVVKDLTAICEETQRFKADNRKLKSRLDSGESSLAAKIRKHEEEAKLFQRLNKESDEKLRALEREAKTLRDDGQRQQEELADIKNKNAELVRHLVDLETKKKLLEERLMRKERVEHERAVEWKKKFEVEAKRREGLEEEVETLRKALAEIRVRLTESESKGTSLQVKVDHATEKMRGLKEENARLLVTLNEKQRELDTSVSKLLEAFPDISEDSKTKYKGTGDPMTDMRSQIEANNLRISQIMSHNEKLKQTVTRIEAIRK